MPISNLYVTGLPDGVDDDTFRQLFEAYGTVVSLKLFAHNNYGFVKYATVEEAQVVINELNGRQWGNSTLVVKFANKDQGQGGWSVAWTGTTAGGGGWSVPSWRQEGAQPSSDEGVPHVAAGYSALGWSNISAPAPASSPPVSEPAVDQMQVQSKSYEVHKASDQVDKGSDQVYIKGLPKDMHDDELLHCLAGYVDVVWHKLLKKEGKDTCALVQMGTSAEAAWLVENLHGNIPRGLGTPVSVTFATPRSEAAGGESSWTTYNNEANSWRSSTPPGSGGKGGNNGSRSRYEPYSYDPYSENVATPQEQPAVQPAVKSPSPVVKATPAVSPVYVKGLPKHADELYLYKIFAPFGAITSVRVQTADWGTMGFVKYVKVEDAEVAIENIADQSQQDGSILQLSFKSA